MKNELTNMTADRKQKNTYDGLKNVKNVKKKCLTEELKYLN